MFLFPNNIFPEQQSICFALSLGKVYKLAGKFINLLECLAFSRNKATPGSLHGHGILERGGERGGVEVSGGLEVSAVRCDSTKLCQRLVQQVQIYIPFQVRCCSDWNLNVEKNLVRT